MPPRRSRRARSAVPNPLEEQQRYSDRAADVLFGTGRTTASRTRFRDAVDRTRFAIGPENIEDDTDAVYESNQFTYDPTRTSNPPRPRTLRAGWVRPKGSPTGTVIVQFREGAVYEYSNVPYNVWRNFRRVQSPGRQMNRSGGLIGGGYPYRRVSG
jgi:hypothetical protein